MAKKPVSPYINQSVDIFIDREQQVSDLFSHFESLSEEELKVVVYYGVGGIGKSALKMKIISELEFRNVCYAEVDFNLSKHRSYEKALLYLAGQLKDRYKVNFQLFEFAYVVFEKKLQPFIQLSDKIKFLDESDFLSTVLSSLGDIPVAGIIPKLIKAGVGIDRWFSKLKIAELNNIEKYDPNQIFEKLIEYFVIDLVEYMETTQHKIVIILDTFEAMTLNANIKDSYFLSDAWLYKETTKCQGLINMLPNVLWVVFSRDKLEWTTHDINWQDTITHHELEGFDPEYSEALLVKKAGITDQSIISHLIKITHGHPLYLDLAVALYKEISTIKPPTLTDFDKIISQGLIFENFIRYLSPIEKQALLILSQLNYWNDDIFNLIISEFRLNINSYELDKIHAYSFVRKNTYTGFYEIHEIIRQSFSSFTPKDVSSQLHNCMFEYFDSQLEGLEPKQLLSQHIHFFNEAAYHGMSLIPHQKRSEKEFYDWLSNRFHFFDRAALWRDTLPLLIKFRKVVNLNPNEFSSCLLINLNTKIGFCYYTQGMLDVAEAYYIEALNIIEKESLGLAFDASGTYNCLGLLYNDFGKFNDALKYHLSAYKIRHKVFGLLHTKSAQSLNGAAKSYHYMADFVKAGKCISESIKIRRSLGENGLRELAKSLMTQASIQLESGLVDEAHKTMLDVLSIHRKCLHNASHFNGSAYNLLARIMLRMNRDKVAERLSQLACENKKAVFGDFHPAVAEVMLTQAIVLQKLGNFSDSLKTALHCEKILAESFTGRNYWLTKVYEQIASAASGCGMQDVAIKYQRMIAVAEV